MRLHRRRAPRPRPRRGRDPHREGHRPGTFPLHDYGLNKAWLDASMIACVLLSWLKLLALDGDLARAEPKTLRYRLCTPPPASSAADAAEP